MKQTERSNTFFSGPGGDQNRATVKGILISDLQSEVGQIHDSKLKLQQKVAPYLYLLVVYMSSCLALAVSCGVLLPQMAKNMQLIQLYIIIILDV